ncbi:type VII secretion target [Micromonospora sp. NPDC048871]|uniref:type VII secretion target n=1 Tax=Micromonospora sp. NPDC048871 TaxID=3364259 RepID=UPI00371D98D7
MDNLRALAARLDEASASLSALSRSITAADPTQAVFGADAPGRPGEIGRALHRQWTAATGDRAREARAAAAKLADTADALRQAANRYVETDSLVARRVVREG